MVTSGPDWREILGEAVASAAGRPPSQPGNVPMLHDIAISSIATLIAIAPMAFAAWYDGRHGTPTQD